MLAGFPLDVLVVVNKRVLVGTAYQDDLLRIVAPCQIDLAVQSVYISPRQQRIPYCANHADDLAHCLISRTRHRFWSFASIRNHTMDFIDNRIRVGRFLRLAGSLQIADKAAFRWNRNFRSNWSSLNAQRQRRYGG